MDKQRLEAKFMDHDARDRADYEEMHREDVQWEQLLERERALERQLAEAHASLAEGDKRYAAEIARQSKVILELKERLAAAKVFERERDALAAAMPSEGADAAIGYAAMKSERDEAVALLREVRMGVKNSAVEFGYPYTEYVDSIDAFLAKIKEGGE